MVFKSSYVKKTIAKRPYARRTQYRRPYRMRSRRGGLTKLIKKVSLSNSEPKIASQIFSSLTSPGHQSLRHNVTYFQGNLLKSSQGDTANPGTNVSDNRIGNEIFAKGLKIRMQLINNLYMSNNTYKYFIFRYQSGKVLNDTGFWCGPNGSGGNQNRMIDFVDTREVTILKTGLIQTNRAGTSNMNQSYWDGGQNHLANRMHSTYRDIWIPLNRKIRYDDNNSLSPKFTDIGIAVVAYDVNNTSQSDTIGYLDFVSRLYFRDP